MPSANRPPATWPRRTCAAATIRRAQRPLARVLWLAAALLAAVWLCGTAVAHGSARRRASRTLLNLTDGTYKGPITDPDGEPSSYTATIRITAKTVKINRAAGTVVYSAATNDMTFAPALACRGTLTYRGRSGTRFSFRETIADGANAQCISGGTVTLTRQTSRAFRYTWTMRGFTDPTPTGRLTFKKG